LTERPLSPQPPLAVRSQRQDAGQRALQIDRQHPGAIIFLRSEHDPPDQAADDLCGFGRVVFIFQRLDQSRDRLPATYSSKIRTTTAARLR
jgi:hypothetical protein